MKTKISLGAVVVLCASCAQLREQVVETEMSLSSKVLSRFVNQAGLVLHDRPVLQTSLTAATPSGAYANLSHSVGLDDADPSSNSGDEIDYTLGWSGNVVEKVTLDANVAYYDVHKLFQVPQDDIVVPFLEIGREWQFGQHLLKPRVQGWGFIPAVGKSSSWTLLTGIGLKHEWKISDWLKLNQEADVKYDNGGLPDTDSGFLADISNGLQWTISEHIEIEAPGIRLTIPLTPFFDRDFEVIGYGGIAITF